MEAQLHLIQVDKFFYIMDKYEVVRTIGRGAGGRVLLATEKENGRYVLLLDVFKT